MNVRKRAFSAQTEASASILHQGLIVAAKSGIPALRMHGAWIDRCFVIDRVTAANEMPAVPFNPVSLILTVSTKLSPAELATACRSFGIEVERMWRDMRSGSFDLVVSCDDGDRHTVRRYHDVAECGHRPRRWLSDHELGRLVSEVQPCAKCGPSASMTKRSSHTPAIAARFIDDEASNPDSKEI